MTNLRKKFNAKQTWKDATEHLSDLSIPLFLVSTDEPLSLPWKILGPNDGEAAVPEKFNPLLLREVRIADKPALVFLCDGSNENLSQMIGFIVKQRKDVAPVNGLLLTWTHRIDSKKSKSTEDKLDLILSVLSEFGIVCPTLLAVDGHTAFRSFPFSQGICGPACPMEFDVGAEEIVERIEQRLQAFFSKEIERLSWENMLYPFDQARVTANVDHQVRSRNFQFFRFPIEAAAFGDRYFRRFANFLGQLGRQQLVPGKFCAYPENRPRDGSYSLHAELYLLNGETDFHGALSRLYELKHTALWRKPVGLVLTSVFACVLVTLLLGTIFAWWIDLKRDAYADTSEKDTQAYLLQLENALDTDHSTVVINDQPPQASTSEEMSRAAIVVDVNRELDGKVTFEVQPTKHRNRLPRVVAYDYQDKVLRFEYPQFRAGYEYSPIKSWTRYGQGAWTYGVNQRHEWVTVEIPTIYPKEHVPIISRIPHTEWLVRFRSHINENNGQIPDNAAGVDASSGMEPELGVDSPIPAELIPFLKKETTVRSHVEAMIGAADPNNETEDEIYHRMIHAGILPIVQKQTKAVTHDIAFSLEQWSTPVFRTDRRGSISSGVIQLTLQPATVAGIELVLSIPDEDLDPRNWSKNAEEKIVEVARSTDITELESLWSAQQYDLFFKLYPRLLGYGRDLQDPAEAILKFFSNKIASSQDDPMGLTALENQILYNANKTANYHYTYAYCYYLLCCMEFYQLAEKYSYDLTSESDTVKSRRLLEIKGSLLKAIARGINRLSDVAEKGNGGVRHLTPDGSKDRSASVIVFYTLWKLLAAYEGNRLPAELVPGEDTGLPGEDTGLRGAMERLVGSSRSSSKKTLELLSNFIVGQEQQVLGDKIVQAGSNQVSILAVAYSEDSTNHREWLYGGYLMTRFWMDDAGTRLNRRDATAIHEWERLLSAEICSFWQHYDEGKKMTKDAYDFWYNLMYLSRLFEVALNELGADAIHDNNQLRGLFGQLQDVLLSNLTLDSYQKVEKLGYPREFFLISAETLLEAQSMLRLPAVTQ
ncbi:MAG: hypothetical protein KDB22_11845 [Planctomycetales bacterium]|nr:hypothetical protein [Planctomycetales bacterium]